MALLILIIVTTLRVEVHVPRVADVDAATIKALAAMVLQVRAVRAPSITAPFAGPTSGLEALVAGPPSVPGVTGRRPLLPEEVTGPRKCAAPAATIITAVTSKALRPAAAIIGERPEAIAEAYEVATPGPVTSSRAVPARRPLKTAIKARVKERLAAPSAIQAIYPAAAITEREPSTTVRKPTELTIIKALGEPAGALAPPVLASIKDA